MLNKMYNFNYATSLYLIVGYYNILLTYAANEICMITTPFWKYKYIIGFQLATGARWWYIVGVYLTPEDTTTMERVVEEIGRKPRGTELLVAGDFNVNIAAPEGDRRAEDIATELATEGLEDMARHFLPR